MQILNDKLKESKESPKTNLIEVLLYALYCGLGTATVVLGPLSAIRAHLKLNEPWGPLAILVGAIIALIYFHLPIPVVVGVFVIGLFVSDSARKNVPLWPLLQRTSLLVLLLAAAGALWMSYSRDLSLSVFWGGLVDGWIEQFQGSVKNIEAIAWDVLRGILFYQGPFLLLSFTLLSVWISIGTAAHFRWFPPSHELCADKLQRMQLPVGYSVCFVVLLGASLIPLAPLSHWFSGLLRVVGVVMFIQGCVFLSLLLCKKKVSHGAKTLIYPVLLLLGFYAVVGMGVLNPWLTRRRRNEDHIA